MNRFKMSFNNYGLIRQSNIMLDANTSSPLEKPGPPKAISSKVVPQKNVGLNAPMIGRVYKAKPGCSACGKKVS